MSADRLEAVCARLEAAVTRLESGGAGAGGAAAGGDLSASVEEYDEILNDQFAKFLEFSKTIGGDVAEQCLMVRDGFQAVREFLVTASKHQKPKDADMPGHLKPVSNVISQVQEYREKRRSSKVFNHLSALSESIGALGWISVSPKPGPYCKEVGDAGQFYFNRVIKEAKEKGETTPAEWARSFSATLTALQAYIKKNHTTGVVWNAKGTPAPGAAAAAAAPPPPKAQPPKPAVGGGGAGGPPAGLFAALNKGGDVTQGLKKVSKDQMTHKNPELRGSSVVKASDTAPKAAAAPKATAAVKKPPKFERRGNKWEVEWQDGEKSLVIDDTATKQTIYMYKCTNSVLQVKGKVNNITMDSCKKCGVVFEDVIAGLDIINCQSVQAQVTGVAALVNIDKTDGCQVFLSEGSKNASIVSAKSSEMNICFTKENGDLFECALPEQYRSQWNGKTFVTEPTEVTA